MKCRRGGAGERMEGRLEGGRVFERAAWKKESLENEEVR